MGFVAPGAIPPKWPSAVEDSGGQVFNVKAYGATGNGTTDDTTAIQDAIDALSNAENGTLYFPPGTYLVTASLNLTNITNSSGGSLVVQGASLGAVTITANLSSAYAVFDLTGSAHASIRDLSIEGISAGSQTAAAFWQRSDVSNAGDWGSSNSVNISGTFSVAGLAVNGSDFPHFIDTSVVYGSTGAPIGAYIDSTSDFPISSAYATIAGTLGDTICHFDNCAISCQESGTAAFYIGDWQSTYLDNCYSNLGGTTPTAIMVATSSAAPHIKTPNYRVEAGGSTVATSILTVASGQAVGGELRGTWVLNDGGSVIAFGSTTSSIQGMDIDGQTSSTGTGTPTFFGSVGGLLYSSRIRNYALAMGTLTDAYGVTVIHEPGSTIWTFPTATKANMQFPPGTGIIFGNSTIPALTVTEEYLPATTKFTSSGTLSATPQYLINSASATTQTLPAATANRTITILNIGAGTVTLAPNSGATINGASSISLAQYAGTTCIADGTNWWAATAG